MDIAGLAIGVVSTLALVALGLTFYRSKENYNPVTWAMWLVLNLVIVGGSVAAGNHDAWLSFGMVVGTFFVAAILVMKGRWKWGTTESICAVGIVVAMIAWYLASPKGAVVLAALALWIASVPLMIDTWHKPNRGILWFWIVMCLVSIGAVAAADSWTVEDRFFPMSSVLFSFTLSLLTVLRSRKVYTFVL